MRTGHVFGNGDPKYICDECKQRIPIGSARFHCWKCNSFDMCEKCFNNNGKECAHSHHLGFMYAATVLGYTENWNVLCGPDIVSCMHRAFTLFDNRPFLGVRPPAICKDYQWFTYGSIHKASVDIGVGLSELVRLKSCDKPIMGICAPNCLQWMLVDFGCMFQGMIVVPIHVTQEPDRMAVIIRNSEIEAVACDRTLTPVFQK